VRNVSQRQLTVGMLIAVVVLSITNIRVMGQSSASSHLPEGITLETKATIDRGLAYLARNQDRQGSWSNRGAYGEYPVAMTALAGLALLMDGNTTTQGRYAPHVDRGARYLVRSSTSSGLIARTEFESRPMFGHGFSMLFLSQLYGMTEDVTRARRIHDVLFTGVQLTARAQSRLGGWIYTPDARGDEGSVTITLPKQRWRDSLHGVPHRRKFKARDNGGGGLLLVQRRPV
jgi:hypothetical protein